MMGLLMPMFVTHTIVGGQAFFDAGDTECREQYRGEVFYVIVLMFAVSMCFVFALLLLCILIPSWIKAAKLRQRAARLARRLEGLDGLAGELIDPSE